MKKVAVFLLAVLTLMSLCSCAKPATKDAPANDNTAITAAENTNDTETSALDSKGEEAAQPEEREYVVGLSMPNMNGTAADSYEKILEGFKKYPNVKVIDTNAQSNAMTQVSDLENLIEMGVDLLLVKTLDTTTAAPTLNAAREKGIPVVVFDGNCVDSNGDPAYDHFFGADNYTIGVTMAEELIKKYGETANYVMYEGPAGISVFMDRAEGFHSVIDQHEGWVMLSSQTGLPGRATDQVIMENWIQAYGDKIDVVVDFTDENAIGAINAIDASNLSKNIKIASVNAQMEVLPYVEDGRIIVEVATSDFIIPLVPACYAIMTKGAEIPQDYITPLYVLSAEEAAEFYIEGGYRVDEYNPRSNPVILIGLEYYAEQGYEWFDESNYEEIFYIAD